MNNQYESKGNQPLEILSITHAKTSYLRYQSRVKRE